MKKLSAFMIFSMITTVAFAADVLPIEKLYQSYVKSGKSSGNMPEYGKKFAISGVVLSQDEGLDGNPIIVVAASASGEQLARAVPSSAGMNGMKALTKGAKFEANCTLGLTSGSSYLALQECALKK